MDRDALALANVRPAVPVRSSVFEAIFEVCDATEATRKIALVFERANDPEVVARRRAALVEDVALDAAFRIFIEENPGVFVGRGDKTRKKSAQTKRALDCVMAGLGSWTGQKEGPTDVAAPMSVGHLDPSQVSSKNSGEFHGAVLVSVVGHGYGTESAVHYME